MSDVSDRRASAAQHTLPLFLPPLSPHHKLLMKARVYFIVFTSLRVCRLLDSFLQVCYASSCAHSSALHSCAHVPGAASCWETFAGAKTAISQCMKQGSDGPRFVASRTNKNPDTHPPTVDHITRPTTACRPQTRLIYVGEARPYTTVRWRDAHCPNATLLISQVV